MSGSYEAAATGRKNFVPGRFAASSFAASSMAGRSIVISWRRLPGINSTAWSSGAMPKNARASFSGSSALTVSTSGFPRNEMLAPAAS